MTKLLIVTTISETINAFLRPYACHFRSKGWIVDGLTRETSKSHLDRHLFNTIWPVEWSRNPLNPRHLLQTASQVRRIVEQLDYDLVHVHTPVAAFVTRYALQPLRRRGRPAVIYTAHGFHFFRGGSRLRNAIFLCLEKLAGQWTDYLVVINQEDAEVARNQRIVPPERVRYMPGIGIDLAFYNPDTLADSEVARIRRELQLTPSEKVLLMIAEFVPRKRHQDVLHAFAAIQQTDAHLVLAGDGPLLEPMRRLAATLGLSNRVRFLGQRQDIPVLIRASAATILPSAQEGLPRSVMESLSLATPVIGSNIRGTRDLLATGGGILVDVGDVQGLARAMAWILENPTHAQAMGRQGRAQMAQYDLRRIIALHEELYTQALSRQPVPIFAPS